MEQKPGWTYQFIECLGQNIAVNDNTGILYTEDKTRYTADEACLLRTIGYQLPVQVHIVKKLFGGTVISVK